MSLIVGGQRVVRDSSSGKLVKQNESTQNRNNNSRNNNTQTNSDKNKKPATTTQAQSVPSDVQQQRDEIAKVQKDVADYNKAQQLLGTSNRRTITEDKDGNIVVTQVSNSPPPTRQDQSSGYISPAVRKGMEDARKEDVAAQNAKGSVQRRLEDSERQISGVTSRIGDEEGSPLKPRNLAAAGTGFLLRTGSTVAALGESAYVVGKEVVTGNGKQVLKTVNEVAPSSAKETITQFPSQFNPTKASGVVNIGFVALGAKGAGEVKTAALERPKLRSVADDLKTEVKPADVLRTQAERANKVVTREYKPFNNLPSVSAPKVLESLKPVIFDETKPATIKTGLERINPKGSSGDFTVTGPKTTERVSSLRTFKNEALKNNFDKRLEPSKPASPPAGLVKYEFPFTDATTGKNFAATGKPALPYVEGKGFEVLKGRRYAGDPEEAYRLRKVQLKEIRRAPQPGEKFDLFKQAENEEARAKFNRRLEKEQRKVNLREQKKFYEETGFKTQTPVNPSEVSSQVKSRFGMNKRGSAQITELELSFDKVSQFAKQNSATSLKGLYVLGAGGSALGLADKKFDTRFKTFGATQTDQTPTQKTGSQSKQILKLSPALKLGTAAVVGYGFARATTTSQLTSQGTQESQTTQQLLYSQDPFKTVPALSGGGLGGSGGRKGSGSRKKKNEYDPSVYGATFRIKQKGKKSAVGNNPLAFRGI